MRRRGLGMLTATVLTAGVVAGCGVGPFRAARCLPSPLTAEPATVAVGRPVTVSSPAFECAASYPKGKRYTLTLATIGRSAPVDLGTVPVGVDGAFRATVTVPADTSPGEAAMLVRGSVFDEPCDDTAGSCAGYSVELTLLPPGG